MKKRLQKWQVILSSAFPSATNPYWRALPLRRMKTLLAGVFFTSAVLGFAADLGQLNVQRVGRGFFWPLFFGAAAVSYRFRFVLAGHSPKQFGGHQYEVANNLSAFQ